MRARIAVDLLWLVPGDVGGSEEYAIRTLLAHARHGSSDLRPVAFLTWRSDRSTTGAGGDVWWPRRPGWPTASAVWTPSTTSGAGSRYGPDAPWR